MTDFPSLTADRPQIFISGLLHGDEVIGGNMLTELALFFCNELPSRNQNIDYITNLLSKRYFIFEPLTNPYGYANNVREELVHVNDGSTSLIDPNRDFSFFDNFSNWSTECMQTITARTVNELFRENIFLQSLTFHGGINAIGYPWGNYVHQNGSKSRECPDFYAGLTIGQVLQNYSDSKTNNTIERYFLGDMIEMSYPIDGGMEDWGYSASWENSAVPDKKPIKKCNPYTYSGYDASKTEYDEVSIRSMVFIVECYFSKRPNAASLGNDEIYIFNENYDFYGHIPRNMRIVTSTADLAYPYILFDYIDYENSYVQYNLMGCIQAESSKTYNFKLSLKELKSYSLDNWSKLRNSVDGNKIRIDSLSDWKDCYWKNQNKENSSTKYTYDASSVSGEIEKFFSKNKRTLYFSLSNFLPDSLTLNALLIEISNPDKNWSSQNIPDPYVKPQTHLVRLRLNENYSESNNNFVIKGNKFFYSNLFLFNAKNSAFELDDLDAFFFDSETFKLNMHFLNAFKSNTFATNMNPILFSNLNVSNYIRTQLVINRFIPTKPDQSVNNPNKSSEWLFDVFVIFKIDESFEINILKDNSNNSNYNSSNTETGYSFEKTINGENVDNAVIIDQSKISVLDNLINEKNYFDFDSYKNTNLNKINFGIVYSDQFDLNIRYEDRYDYSKEQKLKKGKLNTHRNSVCFEITNLNLHLGSLKESETIYICKATSEASTYNVIKNTLFQAFYSIEFLSKSSNFIYKILSIPSIESNSNLPATSPFLYSAKSKLFTKSAFCFNSNTNLSLFALNIKNERNKVNKNFNNGSGILFLYQQLFEQSRNFTFDASLNYSNDDKSLSDIKENFILFITKKSNLILGIKIITLIPSYIKITKISFTQNYNFFDNSSINKSDSIRNFYMEPIVFSLENKKLSSDYYFELKILDLNILGKNFIYRIEYTNNSNTETINAFDSSCVLFEEIKNDENLLAFIKRFDYEGLNPMPSKNSNNDNIGMIVGIVVGFIFAIVLIVLFIFWRRKKRVSNITDKSIPGQKSVYDNLEIGTKINNL